MRLRLALAALVALLVAACTTPAPQLPPLAEPSVTEPEHLRIVAPDTPGAHQAVLLVPGCDAPLISARSALMTRYAERLRGQGLIAAILNYPSAPDCRKNTSLASIVAEIKAALAALRARPDVDVKRLHVVGWSWGASAVLALVTEIPRQPGLLSADALYPFCPDAKPWQSEVTLQMLLAAKDTAAPAETCKAWAKKSDGPAPIVIHTYVGVGHGYDADEAGDPQFAAYNTGTKLTFDASTAYQAWLDLMKFLNLALPVG